ncbi:hemerythrin domain-containing protein [Streptomyces sp. NPDC058290]|uniref:hemerythrin domain-containing protein n=1 Tax=Streptomyces sp. NPDC058290 TaxID=3346426 RepID=UPI0036EB74A5
MDGIVLLREDHKSVERLFKRFEKTADDDLAERRTIADEVVEELTVHAWIEEQVFYPAARQAAPETTVHILESIEEHHAVVWMLSELKDMDSADERFKAKMSVLMENVRHHVEEEEQDWFPDVRKAMGRNRLTEFGDQLEAEKKKAERGQQMSAPGGHRFGCGAQRRSSLSVLAGAVAAVAGLLSGCGAPAARATSTSMSSLPYCCSPCTHCVHSLPPATVETAAGRQRATPAREG